MFLNKKENETNFAETDRKGNSCIPPKLRLRGVHVKKKPEEPLILNSNEAYMGSVVG